MSQSFASIIIFVAFAAVWKISQAQTQLIITGIVDGPLSGGLPKAVEFYALGDISDLSLYGIGIANNGDGTEGEEYTFPSTALNANSFIYFAYETTGFYSFFGNSSNYTIFDSSVALFNGNDAVELYYGSTIVDAFGDSDVNGYNTDWDYLDGWAYRIDGTTPDGANFNITNWYFSGADALDGDTSNSAASTPFPIGSYVSELYLTSSTTSMAPSFIPSSEPSMEPTTDS